MLTCTLFMQNIVQMHPPKLLRISYYSRLQILRVGPEVATKTRGLEQLCYVNSQKDLDLLGLEKGKLQRDLRTASQDLKGGTGELGREF